MFLKTLYLHNFRCYENETFEFCPGVNSLFGPNAAGKTSVLEAIYFLSTGSSFRTSQIKDLIKKDTSGLYVEAVFVKHGIEQTLKISFDGKEKKVIYNKTICPSISSLLGVLQAVVMTPDDVQLIKGAAAIRRRYLDVQLAQSDPLYVHHLTRYNRAMRQRNVLLRSKSFATLSSWEQEMANSASYIVQQRLRASDDIKTTSRGIHHNLTEEQFGLQLRYQTSIAEMDRFKELYCKQLQQLRPREAALGRTLLGPHRDDMLIAIGDKEARHFASEGQQRSCVAALRLAEWSRMNSIADASPLMLIDDLGVSLDLSRRERLIDHVQTLGQVFLSSTQLIPLNSNKVNKNIEIKSN